MKYLDELLGAIGHQRYPGAFEILAVDSGSSDRTVETVREHSVRCPQTPPESFNHGETRNLAAREADTISEYLVYLSQDALQADEGWLANLIAPVWDDPKVAGDFK